MFQRLTCIPVIFHRLTWSLFSWPPTSCPAPHVALSPKYSVILEPTIFVFVTGQSFFSPYYIHKVWIKSYDISLAPQNDVAQCVLNMSSLPLNLAKLHQPPSRVCGAYGVSRVRCYAPSLDMKIGLTGLASKIGVYSHELGSRKRGVQLSNSAFMTCRHHRQHRQEEERRVP